MGFGGIVVVYTLYNIHFYNVIIYYIGRLRYLPGHTRTANNNNNNNKRTTTRREEVASSSVIFLLISSTGE